jgi:dolichyldiphosphatase
LFANVFFVQDPTDYVSLACAYLALLPQALCVVYATLIIATREVEIGLMFAGQLACEALNFALKRFIKEERPAQMNGKGYGMPSSHAQFITFWSVSLALFLLVRHRPKPVKSLGKVGPLEWCHQPWGLVERVLVSAAGMGVAAATAWSRIYLNYHTTKQVLVGVTAGVVIAVGWFAATAVARHTGLLGYALETPVARAFRLRDLVTEEDMCQAGWEKWEGKKESSAATRRKTKTK